MADGSELSVELAEHFSASPEEMWAVWSDLHELCGWHAERANGDLELGGDLHLGWDSLGVSVDLEITAWEPGRCLSLRGGPAERPAQELSILFEPRERGTRVALTHRGFTSQDEAEGTASGWRCAFALQRLYLDQYRHRTRRCTATLGPTVSDLDTVYRYFTEPALLGRWLGETTGTLRDQGAPFSTTLPGGRTLTGHVIGRTPPRDLVLALPDLEGALVLRSFSVDGRDPGAKLLGIVLSTWSEQPELLDPWRDELEKAMDRLLAVLGNSGASA